MQYRSEHIGRVQSKANERRSDVPFYGYSHCTTVRRCPMLSETTSCCFNNIDQLSSSPTILRYPLTEIIADDASDAVLY